MAAPELGPWEPLTLPDTMTLFSGATFRWWISGGLALELHLGQSWREHGDTDVGVARHDVAALWSVLPGWDIHVAAAGRLEPWTGGELRSELHQNNLWCRRRQTVPWSLDITIGEGDAATWIYRRDQRLRLPWQDAVLQTADGIPYLAPELQLLFKSEGRRDKDEVDAREVIPRLEPPRRDRLSRLLPADHPWHLHVEGTS